MRRTYGDLARWLGLAVLALSLQAGAAQDAGTGMDVDQGWTSRMHFSGYGELHLNFPKTGTMDSDAPSRSEIHRFTLGWGYEWTDTIRFAAEVDFEHNASELEFEFGYVEIDVAPDLSIRAGSVLMPIGSLNENHEPVLFYSVERPYVHVSLIPTTWQENGLGVTGQALEGQLAYRAYLVPGLDAGGFTTKDGLRKGRSKGIESETEDVAFAGRLEYSPSVEGLSLGGSLYVGGADQGDADLGSVDVTLFSVDVQYRASRFEVKGEFIRIDVDGADMLSTVAEETIGDVMQGWYVEGAYHVLPQTSFEDPDLVVFVRREDFNTNEEVPSGFTADAAADREVWTFGVAFLPIDRVSIKADVESWEDGTGDSLTRVNLGVAFMF